MKENNKHRQMNKLGVSEIVSYVLLISIAMGISVGVYSWMRAYAVNPNSVDCKEGTSITIQDYSCVPNCPTCSIRLTIRNNGRFNISGVIVVVGNNSKREPEYYLKLYDNSPTRDKWSLQGGYSFFSDPLKPEAEQTIEFSNNYTDSLGLIKGLKKIEIIQVKPFIIDEKNNRIICQSSIKQNINGCIFNNA
ncbi:Uncharacterised protein [uncultured archaeon]|nr:Uncharacterised protein [uncultured archaeon]